MKLISIGLVGLALLGGKAWAQDGKSVAEANNPSDYFIAQEGAVLHYQGGMGDAVRVVSVEKKSGSIDVGVIRKFSVGLEISQTYRIDHDTKKIFLVNLTNPLGRVDCSMLPEIVLDFPLRKGKKWTTMICGSGSEGRRSYTKRHCSVVGQKTVKVPAGKFETWVVRSQEDSGTSWSYYAKGVGVVLREDWLKSLNKRARLLELLSTDMPAGASAP
jgi:hypothetical protein